MGNMWKKKNIKILKTAKNSIKTQKIEIKRIKSRKAFFSRQFRLLARGKQHGRGLSLEARDRLVVATQPRTVNGRAHAHRHSKRMTLFVHSHQHPRPQRQRQKEQDIVTFAENPLDGNLNHFFRF